MDKLLINYLIHYETLIDKRNVMYSIQKYLVLKNINFCAADGLPKTVIFIPLNYATFNVCKDMRSLFGIRYNLLEDLWSKKRAILLYGTLFSKDKLYGRNALGPAIKLINSRIMKLNIENFLIDFHRMYESSNPASPFTVYICESIRKIVEFKFKHLMKLHNVDYKSMCQFSSN